MINIKNGLVKKLHIKNDHLVWRKGEKYSAVYQSKGKFGLTRVLDGPRLRREWSNHHGRLRIDRTPDHDLMKIIFRT